MSFEVLDGVLNINATAVMTTAMAAVLLLIGYFVKGKVSALTKYCIPAPVVGGFLFMFVTFAGYMSNTFTFNFDTAFQDPFMLAFFTTVGLGASLALLKKGGILLIRGNAVIDAGIALETLAIHFLQHDSVVIDIIIDADFALSIMQTMKSTDILCQRSLP